MDGADLGRVQPLLLGRHQLAEEVRGSCIEWRDVDAALGRNEVVELSFVRVLGRELLRRHSYHLVALVLERIAQLLHRRVAVVAHCVIHLFSKFKINYFGHGRNSLCKNGHCQLNSNSNY